MAQTRARRDEPIRYLLLAIDQAFDHSTWHGTNLRGSIRGLTAAGAMWRPRPGRHNVWEEVLHAANWNYAVRRRLTGEKRSSFALKGSNWFPAPERAGDREWKDARGLLDQMHQAFRRTVAGFPPEQLSRAVMGSKWSAFDSILGVAFHDIYHAGQIQMLKRLHKNRA